MTKRDWLLRRVFVAAILAALVGMGAGTLYIHEVAVTVAQFEDNPVDPGRPLPKYITDQYGDR